MSQSKILDNKNKLAIKCVCGYAITNEELSKIIDKKISYKEQGNLAKGMIECPECGMPYIYITKKDNKK